MSTPNPFLQSGGLLAPFQPGDLTQDPGYQFRLQQGLKAIQNATTAQGMHDSGAALKALQDYAQGSASQEYQAAFDRYQQEQQNAYNRLAGVSGQGMQAAGQIGQFGANQGNALANAYLGTGQGMANIFTGTSQDIAGMQQGLGTNMANMIQTLGTQIGRDRFAAGLSQVGIDRATSQQIINAIMQAAQVRASQLQDTAANRQQGLGNTLGQMQSGQNPLGQGISSLLRGVNNLMNPSAGGGQITDAFGNVFNPASGALFNPGLSTDPLAAYMQTGPADIFGPGGGLTGFPSSGFSGAGAPAAGATGEAATAAGADPFGAYGASAAAADPFAGSATGAASSAGAAGAGIAAMAPVLAPLAFAGIAGLINWLDPSNQNNNVQQSLDSHRQQLAAAGLPVSVINAMGTGPSGADPTGFAWYALTPQGQADYARREKLGANVFGDASGSPALPIPHSSQDLAQYRKLLSDTGLLPQATIDSLDPTQAMLAYLGIAPQGRDLWFTAVNTWSMGTPQDQASPEIQSLMGPRIAQSQAHLDSLLSQLGL